MEALEQVKKNRIFYQHLVDQKEDQSVRQPERPVIPARRYHRASGMINPIAGAVFHQRQPYQANVVLLQDILSTTSVNAGYMYDINEKTGPGSRSKLPGFIQSLIFRCYRRSPAEVPSPTAM